MDPSSLAARLNSLENSWSSLDAWLNVWTFLVVVGVALEIVIIAVEFRHQYSDFKRNVIHTPEMPSIWVFALGMLGAGLVAIGVAGEFRIHIIAGKIESDMRGATRQSVASAERDAGNANRDAWDAKQRAGALEKEAAQLRKDASSLQRDVANANAMADEARSMAKSAELARAELEARIAPRTLTPTQRQYDAKQLAKFARSLFGRRIVINFSSIDLEATIFAVEIRDALARAQIRVELDGTIRVPSSVIYGVRTTGTGLDREFIVALSNLLRQNTGSRFLWDINPKYSGQSVIMDVLGKPPLDADTLEQLIPAELHGPTTLIGIQRQ